MEQKAKGAVARCVFYVDQGSERSVEAALKDGTMNGKMHTEGEIEALKVNCAVYHQHL